MLHSPMDVLSNFPVRKTKSQKEVFRDAVQSFAEGLGYPVTIEKGRFGSQNVVMGDPETAKYLVTAHYDTCARMPFPNFIMPCNVMVFVMCQLGKWLLIAFVSILISTLCGMVFGKWSIAPAAVFAVLSLVALSIIGPSNPSNANDNSSGVVTVLEMLRSFPENRRHKVCFVLFDLEEAGLIGSASYRKTHRNATDNQIVLNLDCVGEGDQIRMFPSKTLKEDRKMLTSLYKACGYFGKKNLLVHEKGFAVYPSDQMYFPYGVGICSLKQNKHGLYVSKIHTPKDTVLEETNVNILRAALTSFICCDAVN